MKKLICIFNNKLNFFFKKKTNKIKSVIKNKKQERMEDIQIFKKPPPIKLIPNPKYDENKKKFENVIFEEVKKEFVKSKELAEEKTNERKKVEDAFKNVDHALKALKDLDGKLSYFD